VEAYRTPDDRFAALPGYTFAPHYIELDGLRQHYVDEGSGPMVLMLHGEPTWSYLYRNVIPAVVAAGHRVVAPDLIGCGRSDKPVGLDWYTYDNHVAAMRKFVEELDLRDITLVVHDWGGPIGLRLAMENEARFARLVILNTGIMTSGENRMPEAWWSFRNFVDKVKPDVPVGMLIQGACFTPPAPEVLAAYEAPFPEPEAKWGVSAFPLIVPTSAESPGGAAAIAAAGRLREWTKPALVAFSDSDPIFPTRVGENFVARIPGARRPLTVIPQASHFLQEDQPGLVASAITGFLAETGPAATEE